jgi:plastocyanin
MEVAMRRFPIVVAVAALALVAVACGKTKTPTTPSGNGTTPPASGNTDPITKKGTKDVSALTKFSIGADNEGSTEFYFDPTFLKAKAGQKVTVALENKGTVPHNFSITALNVNQDLAVGKTETITFTLPASGDVPFFCEYHHASGMRGAFFFGSAPQATGGQQTGRTTY